MRLLLFCLIFTVMFSSFLTGSIKISLGEYLVDDDIYIQSLKVGKDGKIYIADKKNSFIRVFSKDCTYLHPLGGSGQGPGQFQRWSGAFDIDDKGNVFQVDFFNCNKRITQFLPDGKTVKTFPLQTHGRGGGIYIFSGKNSDLIIGKATDLLLEKKKQLFFMGSNIEFVILKPGGKTEKILFKDRMIQSFSDSIRGGWPNIPMAPFLISAFHSPSNRLIYQQTNSDRLSVLNVKTGKKIEILNGFDKKTLSADDLNDWWEEKKSSDRRIKIFEPLYKKYLKYGKEYISSKPIIFRIIFNSEGCFYVVSHDKKKKQYVVNKFSNMNIFQGKMVFKRIPRFIGSEKLYYLDYDEEEDNYYLVIEKRAGELFW